MTGILQNQESGVLTLTLNRVDKKNSLNASMYARWRMPCKWRPRTLS